ncbi:MAG: biotin/lipoyl-binding protein [Capsulimonadaceae bacterium]|nr:biotin/lipoyl-binding protein [Capsulimonadaceae bacterium]
MTINDIQNLIDLLADAPEVTELAVTAKDGSEITIKRRSATAVAPRRAVTPLDDTDAVASIDTEQTLLEYAPALSAIASTMVGVFHEATPRLTVGATVSAGQRVGFIEAIKLMNEVVSTASGTVVEVLIEEGQPVEYGQVLYNVAPAESPAALGDEDEAFLSEGA